ncbi:MAG: hypothetical protein Q9223_007354, partial [Gallowayella weberi]
VDPDYFNTPDMIFNVLRDIYEDKNLRQNSRRKYLQLKMFPETPFANFYSEFKKLGSILGYSDQTLMDDIIDKLLERLRAALRSVQFPFTQLSEMKQYLQRLDDEQRAGMAQEARRVRFHELKNQAAQNMSLYLIGLACSLS